MWMATEVVVPEGTWMAAVAVQTATEEVPDVAGEAVGAVKCTEASSNRSRPALQHRHQHPPPLTAPRTAAQQPRPPAGSASSPPRPLQPLQTLRAADGE